MFPTETAAEMSGVILRKKLDKTVWAAVDGGVKTQLQAGLVQIVRTEGSMKVRSAAVEVIQRVCELILESTQQFAWDDMYQAAVQLVQAGADVLVAGNYVFKAENPTQTISDLKKLTRI